MLTYTSDTSPFKAAAETSSSNKLAGSNVYLILSNSLVHKGYLTLQNVYEYYIQFKNDQDIIYCILPPVYRVLAKGSGSVLTKHVCAQHAKTGRHRAGALEGRLSGTEVNNTRVLSFSVVYCPCASSPDQLRQEKPVCRFSYWSPLVIVHRVNKGNSLFFQDACWPYFHLPLNTRMLTCSRALEGRYDAFMRNKLTKPGSVNTPVGRELAGHAAEISLFLASSIWPEFVLAQPEKLTFPTEVVMRNNHSFPCNWLKKTLQV